MVNAIDLFILVTLMAIVGAGFFNGVSRVTAAIIAIYFGAVFAAALYRPISDLAVEYLTTMNPVTGDLVFFVLLFGMFSGIFTVIVARWLGDLRLPRRIAILDNIGGAALGIAVSGLALTLSAMLLTIVLQALNQTFAVGGSDAFLRFLQDEMRESSLMPIFLRMTPFFMRILSPWFPSGLPAILVDAPPG